MSIFPRYQSDFNGQVIPWRKKIPDWMLIIAISTFNDKRKIFAIKQISRTVNNKHCYKIPYCSHYKWMAFLTHMTIMNSFCPIGHGYAYMASNELHTFNYASLKLTLCSCTTHTHKVYNFNAFHQSISFSCFECADFVFFSFILSKSREFAAKGKIKRIFSKHSLSFFCSLIYIFLRKYVPT